MRRPRRSALKDRIGVRVQVSPLGSGRSRVRVMETLKHGWVPLAVRSGDGIPAGNRALLAGGAIELSFESAMEALRGAKVGATAGATTGVTAAAGKKAAPGN